MTLHKLRFSFDKRQNMQYLLLTIYNEEPQPLIKANGNKDHITAKAKYFGISLFSLIKLQSSHPEKLIFYGIPNGISKDKINYNNTDC
jgi:hypothetical protein